MGQLQEVANEFRSRLLANEVQAAQKMVGAYARVLLKVEPEVIRLTGIIEDRRAKGLPVGPGMSFRAERMDSILTQTRSEFARWSGVAARTVSGAQQTAVHQSVGDTLNLTLAALGNAPAVATDVLRNRWDHLPTNVLEEFVGRSSDGSPLKTLFQSLGVRVQVGLETSLTAGLAAGYNPRQIAREVRREFGLGLNRALLISRTETITAYREATRRTYQEQPDIVGGWIWHSALGKRTCPACWAMHGTVHSNDERLDGHPSCRCSMIPITPSWEELGFTGLPDTRPQVPLGTDLFEEAPKDVKVAVLGRKGYAAYEAGEVKLVDFLARTDSEQWGTTRYARSTLAIREDRGGFQTGEEAQGGGFVPVFPSVTLPPNVWDTVTPLVAETPAPAPETPSGPMTGQEAAKALLASQEAFLAEREALKASEELVMAHYDEALSAALRAGTAGADDATLAALRAKMQEFADRQDAIRQQRIDLVANRRPAILDFIRVKDPLSVTAQWKGRFSQGRAAVQTGLDEFNQMVGQVNNPRKSLVTFITTPKRAFYRNGYAEVALDKWSGTETIIHEMGHWLEDWTPEVRAAATRFLDRRTVGEATVRLKDLFPRSEYKTWEVTTPDKFVDPYVGKRYGDGSTEVVSMGLERMWLDPVKFAKDDPDHFAFIWDVVRGVYQ